MNLSDALRIADEERAECERAWKKARRIHGKRNLWKVAGDIPSSIHVITKDGKKFGVMATKGYWEDFTVSVLWDVDGEPQNLDYF